MKTFAVLIAFVVPTALTAFAADLAPVANATNRFNITGMTCEGCAGGLRSELARVKGVATARVALTNREAVVVFDTNRVTSAQLLRAISEAGFTGKLK
jgi:copper chaperone CopZ